jgi:hypothetical protein
MNKVEKSLDQPKTHLEKFSEIGFIGCIDAESNLAENTEFILNQEMKKSQ